MYAKVIDNAGSKQLKPFFQDHISTQAAIKTDKWRGYIPLKEKYPYLIQIESGKKGKNFPEQLWCSRHGLEVSSIQSITFKHISTNIAIGSTEVRWKGKYSITC